MSELKMTQHNEGMSLAEVLAFLDGRLEISRSINGVESEPTRRLEQARAAVAALVAERDALRAAVNAHTADSPDARRYRWLLPQHSEVWLRLSTVPDNETDAVIDAMMETEHE